MVQSNSTSIESFVCAISKLTQQRVYVSKGYLKQNLYFLIVLLPFVPANTTLVVDEHSPCEDSSHRLPFGSHPFFKIHSRGGGNDSCQWRSSSRLLPIVSSDKDNQNVPRREPYPCTTRWYTTSFWVCHVTTALSPTSHEGV
jgi:hypothetical protein